MPRFRFALILLGLFAIATPCTHLTADDSFTPVGATRIDVPIGGTSGYLFRPANAKAGGDQPWLWYAPALYVGFAPGNQLPNASTHWLFEKLLARGVWIAGVNVGESYGSPAGRAIFTQFYRTVTSQYHLSARPCLLVQSRGGLMGFGWAAEHPDDVNCIGGIYPVSNLASWPPRDSPRFAEAAKAYGYDSQAAFAKRLIRLSPISHERPLVKAKIPILILHGDSDKIVPLALNSQKFVETYQRLGGKAELIVVPGKGHQEVDEYFKSERLLNFLLGHLLNASHP